MLQPPLQASLVHNTCSSGVTNSLIREGGQYLFGEPLDLPALVGDGPETTLAAGWWGGAAVELIGLRAEAE